MLTSSSSGSEERDRSYLQLFRNGAIETATSDVVQTHQGQSTIGAGWFATHLHAFVERARRLMKGLEIEPPASMFTALLGVRGASLAVRQHLTFWQGMTPPRPFDRDNLLFRDILISVWEGMDTRTLLNPVLDELWQSAGLARCFDYDEQGNWKPNP